MRCGLILIDLQNDFLARPGLVPAAELVVANAQRLLDGCRRLGVPVFRVETRVRADGSNAMPHWRRTQRRDCVEGTPGVEAPPQLSANAMESSYVKPFFNAFDVVELEADLTAHRIDTLVVAGLYTHACVRDAVLAAYSRGYQVWIASDALASTDAEHARLSLEFLEMRAASAHRVDEILRRIGIPSSAGAATAGQVWRHRDPCDWNATLWEIPIAARSEVDAAVGRARSTAKGLRDCSARTRRASLRSLQDALGGRRRELVKMLVTDVAKPLIDAEAEFDYALSLLAHGIDHLAADEAVAANVRVRYCPVGVVGLITPWNNPLAIPLGKLAPALGFGNAVVWKPALAGSRIAACLAEMLVDAGCGDALSILTGDADTGLCLASSKGLDALSFTGSTAVGERLAKICAVLGTRFQGELGGNNPVLILDDVDPEAVAHELAPAMFSFSGQRCTAPRRLLIAEAIMKRFAAALRDALAGMKLGPPADADTRIGPLISRQAQQRMAALVASGLAGGGRLLCGGSAPSAFADGCWFEPTVIVDPPHTSSAVTDDCFGPVAVLQAVSSIRHGIALCNGQAQGLVGTIFSADPDALRRFAVEVEAGIVAINQARPCFDAAAPFGGWKASATGIPEHGRWDRDFHTRTKAIYGHLAIDRCCD